MYYILLFSIHFNVLLTLHLKNAETFLILLLVITLLTVEVEQDIVLHYLNDKQLKLKNDFEQSFSLLYLKNIFHTY